MSDGNHTPGPWEIAPYCCEDDEDIAIQVVSGFKRTVDGRMSANWIATCDLQEDNEANWANARLIAAAPETAAERDRLKEINADLLEALEFFIDDENPCRYDHNGWCQEHGGMLNGKCSNALAMEVVTKAKGETK